MIAQRTILRAEDGAGKHFSSAAEYKDFEAARARGRALGRRNVLAPGETMRTPDSRMLEPGDEVIAERDFRFIDRHTDSGTHVQLTVRQQLDEAVFRGRVIDTGYREPEPPSAA